MSQIGEAAELGAATLYLYFPNKEALHAAVSLRILGRMFASVEPPHNAVEHSPYEKIQKLKDTLYSYYENNKSILLNLFHFQTSSLFRHISPEIKEDLEVLTRPQFESIRDIFQEGIDKGYLKDRNPVALTDIVWGMFSGLIIFEESKKVLNPKKDFMKATFDLAFETFFGGLKNE